MLPPESSSDMSRRMAATVEIGESEDSAERLLPHLRWELGMLLSRIDPMALSARDLLAILAVLVPVHSDILAGRTGGPPSDEPGGRRGPGSGQLRIVR